MKKLTSLLITSVFTLGLIATPALSQDKLEKILGTKISIVPPAGFVAATRFSGYQEEESNSSIVVTEISAPISQLKPGLINSEELAKQGMVLLTQQTVVVDGKDATMLKVRQKAYGTEFLKWILLLGNNTESVLVAAGFPQEFEAQYSESLKYSLLTVTWNSEIATSPTEGLDYSLQEYGDLKLAQRLVNSLIYTKNGEFSSQSTNAPVFVVAPSVAPLYKELGIFARERLLKTDNLREIAIASESKITINNLNGYEITAVGKDVKSEEKIVLYQVVLLDSENYYYLMQGQVDNKLTGKYLPVFKQFARSFQRQ
ncbi:hypothetical protein [Myxosarcina sp. GI1]|uniref:hypothetical protein n=1 Tax=Myxosarcina sp. GI1 TaxID=1541065 RepID=UPI000565210D|nr:hypothetical protein [Myxosarcina sp. GI1]